jgi:hypothetical protein
VNIRLVEVFQQKNVSHRGIAASKQSFSLRTIFINPEHVVCMRSDELMSNRLDEGLLPENLDSRQEFTKLYINRGQSGLDVTVVGGPELVQKKIDEVKAQQKTVLKG